MQYLGGKSNLIKRIASVIKDFNPGPEFIWEPFCGGTGATVGLARAFPDALVIASDWSADLMEAIKFLDEGGTIEGLDDEKFKATKAMATPYDKAVQYFMTFGGKPLDSPARPFPKYERNLLSGQRKLIDTPNIVFRPAMSYEECKPLSGHVVYCDPPYAGTEGYRGTPEFDHDKFWQWAKDTSRICDVFVSEKTVPVCADVVWTHTRISDMGNRKPLTELLVRLHEHDS